MSCQSWIQCFNPIIMHRKYCASGVNPRARDEITELNIFHYWIRMYFLESFKKNEFVPLSEPYFFQGLRYTCQRFDESMIKKKLPITDLAKDRFFNVANPRSPIFTHPEVPVINILSHFKSRWIIGGVRECKKLKPFKIWRHHDFKIFVFIFLNLRKYLKTKMVMTSIKMARIKNPSKQLLCVRTRRKQG